MNPVRTSSINRLRIKAKETPKPRIRWQSYALAALMVCGFLVFTQTVMAESHDAPEAPTAQVAQEKLSQSPAGPSEPKEAQQDFFTVAADVEMAQSEPKLEVPLKAEVVVEEEAPERDKKESVSSAGVSPLPEAPEPESLGEEIENLPESQAKAVVSEFYSDLSEGHLGTAYDKLSPEFQETLPFTTFRDGYSNTGALTCEVKYDEVLSDELVRLDIQLSADEGGVSADYYVTCLVEKQGSDWLVSGVSQLKG